MTGEKLSHDTSFTKIKINPVTAFINKKTNAIHFLRKIFLNFGKSEGG